VSVRPQGIFSLFSMSRALNFIFRSLFFSPSRQKFAVLRETLLPLHFSFIIRFPVDQPQRLFVYYLVFVLVWFIGPKTPCLIITLISFDGLYHLLTPSHFFFFFVALRLILDPPGCQGIHLFFYTLVFAFRGLFLFFLLLHTVLRSAIFSAHKVVLPPPQASLR